MGGMAEYEVGSTILPEVVALRALVRAYRDAYCEAASTGDADAFRDLIPMWNEILRRYDLTPGAHFAFEDRPICAPPLRDDPAI